MPTVGFDLPTGIKWIRNGIGRSSLSVKEPCPNPGPSNGDRGDGPNEKVGNEAAPHAHRRQPGGSSGNRVGACVAC